MWLLAGYNGKAFASPPDCLLEGEQRDDHGGRKNGIHACLLSDLMGLYDFSESFSYRAHAQRIGGIGKSQGRGEGHSGKYTATVVAALRMFARKSFMVSPF